MLIQSHGPAEGPERRQGCGIPWCGQTTSAAGEGKASDCGRTLSGHSLGMLAGPCEWRSGKAGNVTASLTKLLPPTLAGYFLATAHELPQLREKAESPFGQRVILLSRLLPGSALSILDRQSIGHRLSVVWFGSCLTNGSISDGSSDRWYWPRANGWPSGWVSN